MILLRNVGKSYRNQVVFTNVSHAFERGKIHGIIGRNGSGKTTMLRLICGIAVPDKGEIFVDGRPVGGAKAEFPKDIGILIENAGFIGQCSGFRNLQYLASIRNEIDDEEICKAMEMVGLDPDSNKWVSRYSLGMKQRLGIAQAIMEHPKLLLLDEPMNGLDKQGVEDMRVLLTALRNEGVTVLFASHNEQDVELLCDTVIELDHGQLTVIR